MKKIHDGIIYIIVSVLLVSASASPCFAEQASPLSEVPPEVSARNAIVIEQQTGKILYEKKSKERAYPASITKIMTALLAIESGYMDRKVVVPAASAGIEGSSIYLAPGEKLSFTDLVYGLMLRSGNDAASAISRLVDGSPEKFVQRMNERARSIGAIETNFVNPSGLFDDTHYTTAYDMALIAREAMMNEEFRVIAGARSWEAKRGEGKYNYFYNKNKVVFEYPGGNGIKIGYTKKSGRTLVASAERDGLMLICVVMGAPDWFNDSYKLMDYAFNNFDVKEILQKQLRLKAVPVRGGDKDHVFIGLKNPVIIPTLKGSGAEAEIIYRLPGYARPPLRRWQQAGTLELYLDKEFMCSYPLYYLEDIDAFVARYR
ncbi:hypothetical protein MASR2M70_06830 [Bacillota bacterium]